MFAALQYRAWKIVDDVKDILDQLGEIADMAFQAMGWE